MLRIGLTGGIGSGKSTVAGLLTQHGATLVDADAISRRLTEPGGAAIAALAAEFGPEIVDGTGALNRDRMRQLVFADIAAKRLLEAILHPMIGAETQRQAAAATTSAIVFDVPLLVESAHWRGRVDHILVVDCEESTQVARVLARSGLGADAVLAIIAQQASRSLRRACADAVIYNDAISLEDLTQHVEALWQIWVRPNP
ncbi:MAG: dephospho-CoA kinase [Burkholderiaceae bacterium]